MMASLDELPSFLEHEIEYEDGEIIRHRFFLSLNRDIHGKWSCGYTCYASDDHEEMAIPQLVINGADNFDEVAIRMSAKLERFKKREDFGSTL